MPEAGKQTDTPSRVSLTACKDGNSACPEPDGAPDGRTAGAVSDFDRPYTALDSCETDITRVHTGIASDPAACRMAHGVVVVLGLVSLVQLLRGLKVISEPAIAVASP